MLRSPRHFAIGLPVVLISLLVGGCGGDGTPHNRCSGSCPNRPPVTYLPIEATPASNPDGGPTDLYVIPMAEPATTPRHVATYRWMLPIANVTTRDGTPTRRFYTTVGEKGGDHLWSLDLTEKSTLTPVQVSNLTFPIVYAPMPATNYPDSIEICDSHVVQGNLNDPDSAMLIMSLPSLDRAIVCSKPTQVLLVHPGDSATTAPTPLPLGSGAILPLYQATGALGGIVALDDAQNLNFYPDATFTHPTQLLSNVSAMVIWQEPPATPGQHFSANPYYAYLNVKLNGATSPGKVYRIDATGALSADLYDFQSPNDYTALVRDDTVYFVDAGTVDVLPSIQVISHGTTAKSLYNVDKRLAGGPYLAGLAAQQLIFTSRVDLQSPVLVRAITVGGGGGTPTTLASSDQFPEVGVVGNDVLITYVDIGNNTASYSTQIVDTSGAILRATSTGSAFLGFAPPPPLQASNMTVAPEIDVVDLNQPTSNGVALKTAGGATFTLPANAIPVLTPLTASTGFGVVATGSGPAELWMYDLTSRVATPIVVPNFTLWID